MDFPWTERELRKRIVKACAALSARNLVAATDGNVARLGPDRVLVTPSGKAKGEITELDILLCDTDGRKIRGRGDVTSEVHVHLAAYRSRPDAGGVVHAHPPIATAFTFAGLAYMLQEPVVPEVVAQIGPIPAAPYLTPGSRALAEAAAPLFKQCDIVMLTQHGAVTLGKEPWAAYLRMEKLEQFATILKASRELAALEGAAVRTLNDAQIDELLESYGKGKRKLPPPRDDTVNAQMVERIAAAVLNRLSKTG